MKGFSSIIIILASIGIFFFFIDPTYKEVQKLQADIEKNKEIIDVANRLDLRKKELNDKFNQIPEIEKESIEKFLPDTVDNVRLIIDINNIAEKFGIVIRDISVSAEESSTAGENRRSLSQKSNFEGIAEDYVIKYADTSKVGVINFSFSVSAKYEVFLEFLKQLEESLRLLDIRNIEVSRGSAGSVFYDYKVTFETYWLK